MSRSDIARRRFLASVLPALAAGVLAFWPASRVLARSQTAPAAGNSETLACLFRNRESALAIGRAYLSQHPEEADKAALERLVFAQLDGLRPHSAPETAALKRSFDSAKRRDFDCGAVVRLGGFMMSRTELRACALVALG